MASLGTLGIKLSADTGAFKSNIRESAKRLSALGSRANSVAGNLNTISQGLSGLGAVLGAVGQGIQTAVSNLRRMDGVVGSVADGVSKFGGAVRSAGQVVKGIGGLVGKAAHVFRTFGNALEKIPSTLATLGTGLGNIADKMSQMAGMSTNASGALGSVTRSASSAAGAAVKTAGAITIAGKAYDVLNDSSNLAEAGMSAATGTITRTRDSLTAFASKAKGSAGAFKTVGSFAGQAASKFAGMSTKARVATVALGGLVTGGLVVAAAGLTAGAVQAAEFERTIAGAAARAGATQQAFNRFGDAARQASLDSAFGANEAGKALRFLAKSGFEVEQATAALPGILEGATAAGMGAAKMGEIASNALRAFGKDASETGQIMDVLVKGATSANTSVQELGQGISIVGGLANEAGVSIEETVAVMASMQDAGVSASRAAVAMRAGISRLLKPTGDAKSALASLGVSARNSSGEFRGMVPVLSDLQEAGASSSQMLEIFGRRAGPTLQTALSEGSGALQSFQSELENSEGTAAKVAGFIRNTLSEQVKVLIGTIETLAANIGSIAVPVLKALVTVLQGVAVAANKAVTFIKTMGEVVTFGLIDTTSEAASETDKMASSTDDAAKKAQKLAGRAKAAGGGLNKQASGARQAANDTKTLTDKISDLNAEIENLNKKGDGGMLSGAKTASNAAEASMEIVRLNLEIEKLQHKSGGTAFDELFRAQKIKEKKDQIKSLRKEAQKEPEDSLESALSEARKKGKEQKVKELEAKRAQKAIPVLEKKVSRLNKELTKSEKKLENAELFLENMVDQDVEGEVSFEQFDTSGMSLLETQKLRSQINQYNQAREQAQLTRQELGRQNKELDEQIGKSRAAVNWEKVKKGAAEETTSQQDAQFRMTSEMWGIEQKIGKLRQDQVGQKDMAAQKTDQEVAALEFKLKKMKLEQKLRIGNITRSEKQAKLEAAKAERMKTQARAQERMGKIRGKQIKGTTARMMAGGAAGAVRGAGPSMQTGGPGIDKQSLEKKRDKRRQEALKAEAEAKQKALQNTQTLTDDMTGLTAALSDAAGASQGAVDGLSAIGSAATDVMGGIMSGGPVGIASGIITGATKLIGGLFGGGKSQQQKQKQASRTKRASERRRDDQKLAKLIGEEVASSMKDEFPQQVIEVGAREASRRGPTRRQQQSRLEDLEEASRYQSDLQFGGG